MIFKEQSKLNNCIIMWAR